MDLPPLPPNFFKGSRYSRGFIFGMLLFLRLRNWKPKLRNKLPPSPTPTLNSIPKEGGSKWKLNNCQTPVLGLGLGVDFTFANNNKTNNKNNKKNPHLNFSRRNGTTGCPEKNAPQFLLNFSVYKHAKKLGHNSLERLDP